MTTKTTPSKEREKPTLEDLLVKDSRAAVRFFMASFGKPGTYKSRLFASAVEVPEFSPLLYLPFEALSPSLDQYLTNPNFHVILPLETAGRKSIFKWVMDVLLPLIAESKKGYKAIFFDGVCSLLMDNAFSEAQDECKKAAIKANNSNHDPDYPCRQCYGRLALKAQAFMMSIRELWKNNPDNAAHIFLTFREKLDERTVGKGADAITTRTYRPELPATTLRQVTHEVQSYFRLSSTYGPIRKKGVPQRDSNNKLLRDFRLRLQTSSSDEVEARDNTGRLRGETILVGNEINFAGLLAAMEAGENEEEKSEDSEGTDS